jgi:oligoribonuclease (3'-5' exoribonuclease)
VPDEERPPPIIVFLDIETSGNLPELHELLEYAAVMLDPVTGETIGEPGLDCCEITIDPAQADWPDRMPAKVREMHEENGLLRDVTERGVNRGVAERYLSSWILRHRPGNRPLWLGGAGVSHFEVRWLPRHLPTISTLLTDYSAGCRIIDTSATRRHLELAGVQCPDFTTAKPHRAAPDVWLHVAEYRWQRELFRRLAAAPDVVAGVPVWLPYDLP